MGLPSSTPYNLYKRHQPAERLPASLSPFSTKESLDVRARCKVQQSRSPLCRRNVYGNMKGLSHQPAITTLTPDLAMDIRIELCLLLERKPSPSVVSSLFEGGSGRKSQGPGQSLTGFSCSVLPPCFIYIFILLINNIKKHRIHDHVTVHVHLELVVPPQHLRRPPYVHRRVQDHLPPRHVGKELLTLVGQLQAAESSREPEELAGVGRLGACLDGSRAEESAGVVDGHVGGGVVDGGHVGVGDVDGEDHLGVEEWEVELQG
ncbi:hypothetical protein BUALT_Bualt13G0057600 [Buddleja alternifolia]|uniref:Uncharacterized protein n=1 Tax=Buddleja alternifolia TaxID=168488 RepID=A0AAV6WKR8_9LAMI|nr:hypothetical protein BUALT_Bualt13G0057600 [Buddleja alternifolia]